MRHIAKYRFVYFLATLYMSLMTLSAVLGGKLIYTPYGVLSGASLISPFWFVIGDMITEVYGFKTVMKLFWSVIVCQFIFAAVAWFVINLPSPADWQGQAGYDLVCGHLLKIAVFQFVGVTIAWNINANLLSKWKILSKGRLFWLRSIGSSGVGLLLFSVISVFPSVYGMFPLNEVISIVIWSCVIKVAFTILLSGPANFIVMFLKFYEGVDEFSHGLSYNPFKKLQQA